jgi:organic radical activating enzyme
MKPIVLPESYNYVGAFLTYRCNLNCPYCLNRQGELYKPKFELTAEEWVEAFARIQTSPDLPITLQGGEPTIHKEFYQIVQSPLSKEFDLLTNGKFNVSEFMAYVDPRFFDRKAPYASIRISYHNGLNDQYLTNSLQQLKNAGYNIGVWGLSNKDNSEMRRFCKDIDVDFREKEYLDKTHGTYKYPGGLNGVVKKCECKPSEMLIGPDGAVYRCHSDLYSGVNSYANIFDDEVILPTDFKPCDRFGLCNPCDIKLKTNRLQIGGHCSVEIKHSSSELQ